MKNIGLVWNCAKRGCFHIEMRPKLEVFNDCFPGKIGMGDIDGIVEINGKGLLLEWKSNDGECATGQRIMLERLTKTKLLTAMVIAGDPKTMIVSGYYFFWNGTRGEYVASDLDGCKQRIVKWVSWASSQPRD